MKTLYDKGDTKVVEDKDGQRAILVDDVSQGWFNPDTFESRSPVIKLIQTRLPVARKGKTALVLGGGACILPTLLGREAFVVDVVEKSELMIELAVKFFGFKPTGQIIIGDAWEVLPRLDKYFYSICDVFDGKEPQVQMANVDTLKKKTRNYGHLNWIGRSLDRFLGKDFVLEKQWPTKEPHIFQELYAFYDI